jgi:Tol biopolymer transport system component
VANGSSAYTAGATGNLTATNPSLAEVGGSRHIAFESAATDLVSGDSNTLADIFVRSGASTTALVSRSTGGTLGNGASADPSISADARAVAFESLASNLVAGGDTLGYQDIFLRLRDLSDDGVFDQAGDVSTLRVTASYTGSLANDDSYDPAVSAYGRFVAFQSFASNLVAGDTSACTFFTTFNCPDVFLYDRETGQTQRVSVDRFGVAGGANVYAFAPAISADGSLVAFEWGSLGNRQIYLRYTGYASRFPISIALLPTPTPTATQPPATSTPIVPVTGGNRVFLPAVQRGP